jgi:ubiquinone/menaquinone biosynthesis C-methylase UbiE
MALEDECAVVYADYKAHYKLDARCIVDPDALAPAQRESERRRLQAIVRHLKPGRGQRFLDVGCGSGWLTGQLAEKGARVVALDMAPAGVKGAKRRFEGESSRYSFVVGDVYHLPFAPGAFDGAVLSEVAEHLEDLDRALEEIAARLKTGRRLVVTVPNDEQIRWHLCVHCNRLTPANAHIRSFTEKTLIAVLEDHGFTVLKVARLSNKLLELLRFPVWTKWLPYPLWRIFDVFFSVLSNRSGFLCAVAVK